MQMKMLNLIDLSVTSSFTEVDLMFFLKDACVGGKLISTTK